MGFKREAAILVILISLCVKSETDSKVECYASASYQATKGKHSCRLSQPNWATDVYFELTHKHCLKSPTVNLFIRNFHGVDDINIDFNEKFSKWKGQKFDGKTFQLILQFKQISSEQLQVKLIFVPVFGKLETQQLLIAIFNTADKSDCIWAETLEIHDQIFLGIGLCGGLALLIGMVVCYRKCRKQHRYHAPQSNGKVRL